MDIITLILLTVVIVVSSLWVYGRKFGKKWLPGPIGLPFVGYLPFLTKKPYVKFQQLAKVYGPVYRLKLGSVSIAVLCDFRVIKEAFNQEAMMGRPPDLPVEFSKETIKTGAFLDKPWKEQRRFSLHMLRDLGFGKTRMEEHMKEEISELLDRMKSLEGTPTKMSELLTPSTSNNIASLLFGNRLKYDDPKRKNLDRLMAEVGQLAGMLGWQTFFPWIRAFMGYFGIGIKGKLSKAFSEANDFIVQEVKQHEATLSANSIRDFIDGYLLEIQKRSEDPRTTFKRDVMVDLSRTFFGAGSETVRVSVDWMLLICAAYPEVQSRIHEEIDKVLGRERFPTRALHQEMSYTEAAICEMHRWKSIIPLNLMRYTLTDTELDGYFVPKHTHVLAVLYAVHHDKKLWGEDVDIYRPERFLGDYGKKVLKPEHFIPFSIGKRSCPGKAFAEVEVFLYVVAILQKYHFSLPHGKKADLEGFLGISLQPVRQELIFRSR